MVAKKPETNTKLEGISSLLSHTITIKDLITIISIAVSLTLAWGVFGTRITVLEKELVSVKETLALNNLALETLKIQLRRLEAKEQDDQHYIDELYRSMGKPLPRRSTD